MTWSRFGSSAGGSLGTCSARGSDARYSTLSAATGSDGLCNTRAKGVAAMRRHSAADVNGKVRTHRYVRFRGFARPSLH